MLSLHYITQLSQVVKPLLRKMDSKKSDEKEYHQELLDGVAVHTKEVWDVTEWLNR